MEYTGEEEARLKVPLYAAVSLSWVIGWSAKLNLMYSPISSLVRKRVNILLLLSLNLSAYKSWVLDKEDLIF